MKMGTIGLMMKMMVYNKKLTPFVFMCRKLRMPEPIANGRQSMDTSTRSLKAVPMADRRQTSRFESKNSNDSHA